MVIYEENLKKLRFINDYYDKFKTESRIRREGIKRDPLAVTVFYQKEIEKKTFTPVFFGIMTPISG